LITRPTPIGGNQTRASSTTMTKTFRRSGTFIHRWPTRVRAGTAGGTNERVSP
jgi:hypothetical protein